MKVDNSHIAGSIRRQEKKFNPFCLLNGSKIIKMHAYLSYSNDKKNLELFFDYVHFQLYMWPIRKTLFDISLTRDKRCRYIPLSACILGGIAPLCCEKKFLFLHIELKRGKNCNLAGQCEWLEGPSKGTWSKDFFKKNVDFSLWGNSSSGPLRGPPLKKIAWNVDRKRRAALFRQITFFFRVWAHCVL